MDIKRIMTFCPTCMPSRHICLPFSSSISPPWLSSNSGSLAEDGGISLADYSPHGELLCELSDITLFDKSSSSSSSHNSKDHWFRNSNEALADKSVHSSDSSYTSMRKFSVNSWASNEAEAVQLHSVNLSGSASSPIDGSCCTSMGDSFSLTEADGSMQSFAETVGGGEGLAEESSSCDTSQIVDSLDSLCSTPTSANIDSISLPASSPLSPQFLENWSEKLVT